jgi:hypothetical protein
MSSNNRVSQRESWPPARLIPTLPQQCVSELRHGAYDREQGGRRAPLLLLLAFDPRCELTTLYSNL